MSEMSRNARRAMRAKIHRITTAKSDKVDASDYGPEEVLDAGVKTGMRPVSRRAFKKGGKVVANEGKDAVKHAGKKARSGSKHLTIDALVNRNYKDANEGREGKKHIGGLKTGGRAEKNAGGPLDSMGGDLYGLKSAPVTSRAARAAGLKTGGRAKKNNGGFSFDAPKSGAAKIDTTSKAYKDAVTSANAASTARTGNASSQSPQYRAKLGTDKQIVSRGNQEPYEPMPRKSGGKAHMDVAEDRALIGKMVKKGALTGKKRGGFTSLDGEMQTQEKVSGRVAKRDGGSLSSLEMNKGGRAKGKTNINIIIGTGQKQPMAAAPGLPQPPGGGIPVPMPPQGAGAPPPMGGAPMPMPMPMPPAPPMGPPPMGGAPMPRKRGGRTYRSYKDMDAGAGSGLGRLEKTEIQKHKK